MVGMMTRILFDFFVLIILLFTFKTKLFSLTTLNTFSLVLLATLGSLLSTLDTVATDVSANLAISLMFILYLFCVNDYNVIITHVSAMSIWFFRFFIIFYLVLAF